MGKRIIIEVSGGLVNAVHSNDKNIHVDVLDHDNWHDKDCEESDNKHYKQLENEIKALSLIF